jgi:hypothetical protein
VLYGFDQGGLWRTQTPSLKVASESYREEICEVARLHDTRGREAEHEGPAVRERVVCRREMQKLRSSIGRFMVRPRT